MAKSKQQKAIDRIAKKYGVSTKLIDYIDESKKKDAILQNSVTNTPVYNANALSSYQPVPIQPVQAQPVSLTQSRYNAVTPVQPIQQTPVRPMQQAQPISLTQSRYNAQVLAQPSPTQTRYQAQTPQPVIEPVANNSLTQSRYQAQNNLVTQRKIAEKKLSDLMVLASGVDLMENPELQGQIKAQQDILKNIDAQIGTMSAPVAFDEALSSPLVGIYKGVSGIAGLLGANNDASKALAEEKQQRINKAMQDQPIAAGAGQIASDLAGLFIAGEATGGLTKGMPTAFRAAATGAAYEAGKGAGNVLSGEITPKQYARDITRSAVARGGASAISDAAYTGVASWFRDKEISGLASDFAKRLAKSGSYSTSRTAINYLGLSEEQKKQMQPGQLGREFLTDFAYSLIDSAIGTAKAASQAQSLMNQYEAMGKNNMKNVKDLINSFPHMTDEVTGATKIFVNGEWINASDYEPITSAVRNTITQLQQSMDSAYMAGGFAGKEQDYYDARKYLSAATDMLNEASAIDVTPTATDITVPAVSQPVNPTVNTQATDVPTMPQSAPQTTSQPVPTEPKVPKLKVPEAPTQPQNESVTPVAETMQTMPEGVKAPTEPQREPANDIKSKIINAVRGIRDKVLTKVEPIVISENIDSRLADDIKAITGIDVSGWHSDLTINGIRHIEKRHGIRGLADSSMSDENAYAAIPDIEKGYTNIALGDGTRAYRNRDGSKAKTIVLSMPIGDKESFVVEAVPDTDEKTLHVVTAYSTKKVADQMPDAVAPSGTPNVVSDATSEDNITPKENDVKPVELPVTNQEEVEKPPVNVEKDFPLANPADTNKFVSAATRVLRNGAKANTGSPTGVLTGENGNYITDGHMAVRLNGTIEGISVQQETGTFKIPEDSDRYIKTIDGYISNAQQYTEVTKAPTSQQVRSAIKKSKATLSPVKLTDDAMLVWGNGKPFIDFGKGKPFLSANLYEDFAQMLPAENIYYGGPQNAIIYTKVANGEGVLLGVNKNNNEPRWDESASVQRAIEDGKLIDLSGSPVKKLPKAAIEVQTPAEPVKKLPVATEEPKAADPVKSLPKEDTPEEEVKPLAKPEATKPQKDIADKVVKAIGSGKPMTIDELYAAADRAYGGTMAEGAYTVKDAYDGLELGVNKYLIDSDLIKNSNGDVSTAEETVQKLQDFLKLIPTQTKRTDEQISFQQFSTPPNIAYLANWVANITPEDIILEPSAGIGGLALFSKAWGATTYGNELSERRLKFLNELGLDGTFNLNAEQIDNLLPDNIRPSVVVMNPPFSATAGRTSKNATTNAKRHIEQAIDRLEEGGRLVAILGNGMADDAPAFKSWWNELRKDYNVRANIRIDGSNYRKYGTTFDIQLAVIDKTSPDGTPTITGTYKDLSEIPSVLEGVRNGRNFSTAVTDDTGTTAIRENPTSGMGKSEGGRTGRNDLNNDRSGDRRPVKGSGAETGGTGSVRSDNTGVGQRKESPDRGNNGGNRSAVRADTIKLEAPAKNNDRTIVKEANENPDSVFSSYTPRKVRIKGAKPHPAKLVESAAMASVEPPDVTYSPSLPQILIESGYPSDAQLENIVYAGQAHSQLLPDGKTRKGFFIGDGTGVGKGVQIASIILDNYNQGRKKALWFSDKGPLINDAKRDWKAVGGNDEDLIDLTKIKAGKDITADSGILFGPYSTLASRKDKGLIDMLTKWLGKDFDGVIAFDEAHNMGNAVSIKKSRGKSKPSQKALAGIEVQKAFPNARVVYVTATGATEPSNYAYLERLGLWGQGTAFPNFNDFMSKISDGGVAAMELVARDMKAMGLYMARSISYDDVRYDTVEHKITPVQKQIYNTMSAAWQKVYQNFEEALKITGADKNGRAKGNAHGAIFGAQQRFYNQILTSMSMPSVVESIKSDLADGKSVVIQLVNTNEAQQNRAIAKNNEEGGDLDDLDLTPSDLLIDMVERSYPIYEYEEVEDENGNITSQPVKTADGENVVSKKAVAKRDALIEDLKMMRVPDGPLEMLFDAFGPDMVAEVTGRTRRVVNRRQPDGSVKRVIENRTANSGIADANAFQDGKKRILVFSDAGGTGRSFHADLKAKNQQQRVHYVLQPGWNASKTVQGFGRTHRSNQAIAPIYKLVTTDIMGQKRFTSTIAKRLGQLGALTKGQRDAGNGILGEKDNLENSTAMDTLSRFYKDMDKDLLRKLGLYENIYDRDGKLKEDDAALRDIGKFLNRILALEVDEQNEVFNSFYEAYTTALENAIANGTVDTGLENFKADKIEVIDENVIRKDKSGADTKYVQLKTFNKPVLLKYSNLSKLHNNYMGIYELEDGAVRAVYEIPSKTNEKGEIQKRYKLESPLAGKSSIYVESTFEEKASKLPESEWKKAWEEETGKAPEYNEGTLHLLTGALLPIWDRLPSNNTRVMRVIPSNGTPYLGRVIPPTDIDFVLRALGASRTKIKESAAKIYTEIMNNGKEVLLGNRTRLVRKRVSGENRIEIIGPNAWGMSYTYKGVINETIDYKRRFFVPTGETGQRLIDSFINDYQVVDVRTAADSDTSYSKLPNDPAAWTTSRVGDKNKTPMMLSDIIGKMRHDFGISITTGSVENSRARGQYNKKNNGIRLRSSNDIVTAAHEIGHYFDKQYDVSSKLSKAIKTELEKALGTLKTSYSKSKWSSEGMAEYIRQYLTNKEDAVSNYPAFSDYFLKKLSSEDLALLDGFADEINASLSLDTETAQSSIRLREEGATDFRTIREKARAKTDYLYQKIIDSNNAIKRFDDEVGSNAYLYATNAAYSDNVAGRILEGNLVDFKGQFVGPGLSTVLKGLDTTNKAEYKLFNELLVVMHGPEWIAQGLKVFENPVKNTAAWMEDRKDSILADHPEWEDMANNVIDFVDRFQTAWGVGMNLIDSKLYDKLRKKYPNYVPFNRAIPKRTVGGKRTFANQVMPLKRAKGSGLEIIAPVDNIIDMVVSTVNAAIKNNVVVQLTNAAEKYGADAGWLERIPEPKVPKSIDLKPLKLKLAEDTADAVIGGKITIDNSGVEELDKLIMSIPDLLTQFERGKPKDNLITVLKNGKPEYWKVNDPLLLESLTTLTAPKLNGLASAYAATTRFLTANITGNNPIWSIFSNAPRDLGTFTVYFKDTKNLPRAFAEIAKSYVSAVKESAGKDTDPYFLEYLAVGGGSSSVYSADTDLAKKMRRKYSAKRSQQLWDKYNPVECISFLSDTIERGPRFAAYKMARLSGKDPQEALYEAMDVTVNFRKAGQVSRTLNKVVPFFNAGVQGTDKMVRFFTASDIKGSERKKTAAKRAGLFLAVGAAIATMLYLINSKDDEEKKNYANLSTYTKNSFFCIPAGDGKYITTPKPRELAIWTSFVEAMLETYVNKNPHALDEFYDYVAGNIAPSVAKDIIMLPYNISKKGFSEGVKESMYGAFGSLGLAGVVFDVAANRDFLGKPISRVNPYSKKEPKTYYTDSTSQLAYALGQMFNANPQIIDYAGGQTLGYIWKIQKALFPVGEQYRDWTLGVKNTYVRDSQYSTDLVNWLYDEENRSAVKANTSDDVSDKIVKLTDEHMTDFYSNFNKLNRVKEDRKARDTMLEIITEYRKAKEDNYETPVQKAVNKVVEKTGQTDLLPSVMNPYVKDKNKDSHDLTAAEYIDYQTTYNNLYYEYVEQVLDTTADIDTQVATIKAAREIANERATEMFLERKGADGNAFAKYTDATGYTVPDTAIAKLKAGIDLANNDGSLKQKEVVAEIKKLRKAEEITEHDAYLLFHSRYESDKNNPWKKAVKPLKKY